MTALPTALFTAEQTRELDRQAIAAGTSGAELMQRAGQAAFNDLCEQWPEARHLAILCGGGNNGGDGYVVAALAHQAGLLPVIYQARPVSSLQGDALTMAQRCLELAIPMRPLSPDNVPEHADMLVDGLLGTGLASPLNKAMTTLLAALDRLPVPRLALDLPSGLNADTGMPMGAVLRADMTATFIGLKRGLLTGQGPLYSGALRFHDLQVPRAVYQQVAVDCVVPRPFELQQQLPARARDAHKGRYGHVLVIGGDHGFAGAALMTAQAAARSGAGKVSLVTRPEHVAMAITRQPEVMVRGVNEHASAAPLIKAATVIAIGPGLSRGPWGQQLLEQTLASGKPLVVDADALNLLAERPALGLHDWVLTPHPGEAARLLSTDNAIIQQDRFAALEKLVGRYGGTVLLKGLGTLVQAAQPGRPARALIVEGNPGMASGGMGDVLTGVIAALRAQGLSGFDAARLGAMAHARAADACARAHGERGLLATDLLDALRAQLN